MRRIAEAWTRSILLLIVSQLILESVSKLANSCHVITWDSCSRICSVQRLFRVETNPSNLKVMELEGSNANSFKL